MDVVQGRSIMGQTSPHTKRNIVLFINVPQMGSDCLSPRYFITRNNNNNRDIPANNLTELLLRCPFNVRFSFSGEVCWQADGDTLRPHQDKYA